MPRKGPPIAEELWEQHRDEITALYYAPKGSLPKTMQTMKEKYGFQATKSQYTTKFEAWGLKKYANNLTYAFADQKIKKRKLEGKDTGFIIHARKRTRQEMENEIARNITYTSRLQLLEDIPTPEGVQVFTPGAEASSTSVVLREVCTSNLPCFQLQRAIGELVGNNHRIFKFDAFQTMKSQMTHTLPDFDMPDQSNSQLYIHNKSLSVARSLQKALELEAVLLLLSKFSWEMISLTSCLPSEVLGTNGTLLSSVSEGSGMPPSLQGLLEYFIGLTYNSILSEGQILKGVEWILKNINESFLFRIFDHETITIKIFMRKILPSVVACGNTIVAKWIIEKSIDISNPKNYRSGYCGFDCTLQEICMSTAVRNGDSRMVDLLCTAGFSPQIRHSLDSSYDRKLLWDTGDQTLQTLLRFGADPECFMNGRLQGYPLIDAARLGNLEAVNMLLGRGSRVNVYAKSYFGTPLQAAVYAGHLEMAEFLIRYGADINAPFGAQYQMPTPDDCLFHYETYWSMKTPIQIACAKKNVSVAKLLLNHGADVNLSPLYHIDLDDYKRYSEYLRHYDLDPVDYSPGCNGYPFLTALQHSVQNGNVDLVRLLLSSKANPNSRAIPNWEDTPLQSSIRLGYPEIARILIDHEADVNASPGMFNGRTAIQAAAEVGNIQILQMLLGNDADINASPGYEMGLTALQAAIKFGHPLVAGFLCLSGAEVNAPPALKKGLTAIQAAAEIGDLHLVKDLIRQGADVKNATAGHKAVLASISHRNLPMLKLLVKRGALKNGQGNDDDMPAVIASVMKGWMDGVRYLLDNGADINSCHYYNSCYQVGKMAPLAWSIINHDDKMIGFLLENGANLRYPSAEQPYHDSLCLALNRRYSDQIIYMLIDEYVRADHFILDEEVLATAVRNERRYDYSELTATILNVMSRLPKTLYMAQVKKAWNELSESLEDLCNDSDLNTKVMTQTIKLLLKAGADINSRHPLAGCTLLQKAVGLNMVKLAKFLIEEKAEIQVLASRRIGTPLQEAIKHNQRDFAYFLLEQGADINAPPAEDSGATALQAAAKVGNRNLVLNLLGRDAEVNAPPAEDGGVTALQAAAIKGYVEIAVDLLQHGAHVAAPGAPKNGRTAIDGAAEHGRVDMLQLLLNHYDGSEDLRVVCERAATYAEEEGHVEIAAWLRGYHNL